MSRSRQCLTGGLEVRPSGEVRAVFPTMGTVASLRIGAHRPGGDPGPGIEAASRVRSVLEQADDRFTPYRSNSELCRFRAGRVIAPSPALLEVLAACEELRRRTGGGFDDRDRSGVFDPTGFVKGWAAERAVRAAESVGCRDICLAVGGDVRTAGWAAAGRPWRVAVRGPLACAGVAEVVQARTPGGPLAVATSGSYERGDHVWGPRWDRGRQGPSVGSRLGSVTAIGEDLGVVDGLSTALWAIGSHNGAEAVWPVAAGWPGIEVVMVDAGGRLVHPPAWSAARAG